MRYKNVIFDLDGTLVDSEEGILKCVAYALSSLNKPRLSYDEMRRFIGPSLFYSFTHIAGLSDEEAELAVAKYRERYRPIGVYECKLYPGIEELLKSLKDGGALLSVASAKLKAGVDTVLNYLKIDKYFGKVTGSKLGNKSNDKTEYVREAILDQNAVMVGDTPHDMTAAKQVGIASAGVTYSYSFPEELKKYSPDYIVKSVDELYAVLDVKRA